MKSTGYRQLSEADAAWLAGFIDGDGSIGLAGRNQSNHWYRPTVQIGQAYPLVLLHIIALVGSGKVEPHSKRDFYNLKYGPVVLRWLLPQLVPHLIIKRQQAEILLEYMAHCKYQGKALTGEQIDARKMFKAKVADLNLKPKTRRDRESNVIQLEAA